jgi:DNA-directed RNA polymerase subunit RPC12/RpoP
MSALKDRQQARQRLEAVFEGLLDRYVPADESIALRGRTFREWEDQADEFDQEMTGALLEELATLDESACADQAGRCPHCGSMRLYRIEPADQVEIRSKHGPVVLPRQRCRCRSCDRVFSPSGARLGFADGSEVIAEGSRASGA